MTTINPIQTNTVDTATAFKGKKNYLKNFVSKLKSPYSGKVVSPQEATIEHLSGAASAMEGRSAAELKETALRETMLGHTDFVKGINDVLAKEATKNVYKK